MSTYPTTKVMYFITKSNWGGAQRYVFDLATSLPPSHEPVVVLGGNGVLKEKLDHAGVRVISLSSLQRDISFLGELRSLIELAGILRRERPTILHVNSSKAGGLGALVGRVLLVPRIIFTAHGWAFNEDRPQWQRIIITFFHWLTVLLAHHTIAVSTSMKAQLTWPGAQQRMTVIHPGRAAVAFFPRAESRHLLTEILPSLQPHQHDFWIGTIAELHPVKQLDVMIQAMTTLAVTHPHVRYLIIGDGESRAALVASVDTLGLHDHVFFVGAITEAARYLKAFDAFVLPSRSESFGYVLVEAAQAGLPIVATDVGGIPDIITDQVDGLLVPTKNVAALSAAVTELVTHPTKVAALRYAATARATHFSLQAMVNSTVLLYESNNG